MKLASLGSGSKGNGTLISFQETLLLIDCGFTIRDTEQRLERLGLTPSQLTAVLVTHEHGDHIRGVGPLARKYDLPVYATWGTRQASEGRNGLHGCEVTEVRADREMAIGDVDVLPVPVPHDAREPCQYVFSCEDRRLGVLTDLGSLTPHVVECYRECDALVLECNHDPDLLAAGPYPPSLKRRVGGSLGHLSNFQSASLLEQVNQDRLQHLVLSHLSEQNNTPEHALGEVTRVVEQGHERIRVASQQQGFDWLQLR